MKRSWIASMLLWKQAKMTRMRTMRLQLMRRRRRTVLILLCTPLPALMQRQVEPHQVPTIHRCRHPYTLQTTFSMQQSPSMLPLPHHSCLDLLPPTLRRPQSTPTATPSLTWCRRPLASSLRPLNPQPAVQGIVPLSSVQDHSPSTGNGTRPSSQLR